MYGNPYQRNYSNINQQSLYEQIDNEINNLQQMKDRMKNNVLPQQPSINQTFQLAPTNREVIRYANSIDDVQRDTVIGDTPYFSKDMTVAWVKSVNGNIKTYELKEIIPKDEKDVKIEFLQAQIEELKKGMIKNESITDIDDTTTKPIKNEKPTNVSTISKPKTKKWES